MYALNPELNRSRSSYYQGSFTPHMFTNGFDSGSNLNSWLDDPKKYLNTVSIYDISFNGSRNEDKLAFEIVTSSMKNINDSKDIRLYVAVVIAKVVYPGSFNGMYEHKNVVVEQLLGNLGKRINYIANSDYLENFNWSMPEAWSNNNEIRWSASNIKVVSWIQDFQSKEILQSAEFKF
tara:strand:- start:55 stop:588 length:534 start_codon:yes stop_codon:yes gene_type:complete